MLAGVLTSFLGPIALLDTLILRPEEIDDWLNFYVNM
jgi:hypothetical protein